MARKKTTLAEYQALVQERGQAVLNVMAAIATGQLDQIVVDIPEGDDILGDIAIGLSFIVDDFRTLLENEQQARAELEQRVHERTAELQAALGELQHSQQRYILEQWQAYTSEAEDTLALTPELVPALEAAVVDNRVATQQNGHTSLAVPIHYADEMIGVLGFTGEAEVQWSDDDLAAVAAIAEQVGLALENQRLFDQTQTALNESETLYNFSAWLNTVRSLEEMVQAIASVSNAENTILFLMEGDANHPPAQMTAVANWNSNGRPTETPLNIPTPLSAVTKLVVQSPNNALLFGNIATEANFPEASRAAYAKMNIARIAWLPLYTNERWLGAVGISWPEARPFSEVERRIYQAVMGQTGVALNQYLLTRQIEERARNLEQLAEIEGNLSQTSTPEELVLALAHGLQDSSMTVSMQYLELDARQNPIAQTPVAIWHQGGLATQDPRLGRAIPLSALTTSRLWLENPNQVLYIEDVATDPRVDETTRQTYAQLKMQSAAVIPLRSGGVWQGTVALTAPLAHTFTPQQRFIMDSLLDSLSAIVASQRAQLAQREALAETEQLYTASVGFNRAESVDDVLRVVVETLEGTGAVSATLWDLTVNEQNTPITQTLVAIWRYDNAPSRMPLGTTINLEEFPVSRIWYEKPQNVSLIGDTTTSPLLDNEPVVKQMFQSMGIKAQAFLPLTLGTRWVGLISVQWDSTYQFDKQDERLYSTLAAQAANSIDSIILLQNTRQQAKQLRIITQIEGGFSTAETEHQILAAITSELSDVDHSVLIFIDSDATGHPEYFDPRAELIRGKTLTAPRMPRLDLKDFPSTEIWIAAPQDVLIMQDVRHDRRLDEGARAGLLSLKWESYVFLPLFTGGRWQGVLALAWYTTHTVTAIEKFVLEQIMEPLAAVVASRRALLEQQRAEAALRANTEQLEQLTNIQQLLSEAVDENDIVNAMLGAVDDTADLTGLTLGYVDEDDAGNPTVIHMVGVWEKGRMMVDSPLLNLTFDLAYLPSAGSWINNPNDVYLIPDVEQDTSLEEHVRQMYLQGGVGATATIPVRSAGRWQANISFSWSTPHMLSAREKFIFQRLLEGVGAIIASRRAFLAQQRTQRETEQLYNASRRINESTGNLQEIVTALGEVNPRLNFNRAVLFLFDYAQGEIGSLTAAANWYSGQGERPLVVGTRYGRDAFDNMNYLFSHEQIFVEHVARFPTLTAATQADFEANRIRSLGILPVWAGNRQMGAIVLQGEQPQAFPEEEKRPYISLLPQVAVALENKLLLEQTRDRARREQVLREVTGRVRSSTDVNTILKTAAAEIGRALGRKAFITIDTTKK